MERELNVQANVKTKNGKNLKVKALVDSGCTHMRIDKQLVKDKRIRKKPINFSFEVFNTDRRKNGEVTKVLQLKPSALDRRRTLYRIYTRELDRELCTELSTYILTSSGPCELSLAYPK